MNTPQKRNPSNGDLYKLLTNMDARISTLETWKIAKDAANEAVKQYQNSEAKKYSDNIQNRERKQRYEVYKQVGYILGLVSVALYVYLSTRGAHP